MSPKGHEGVLCGNPKCRRPLQQKPGSGRPRKYCDDRCAYAAQRAARRAAGEASTYRPNRPEAARNSEYVREIAYDLTRQAGQLFDTVTHHGAQDLGQALRAFRESQRMAGDLEDLTAALAQQCRDRGARTSDLADAGNVSRSTVSRHWPDSPSRLRQRMENRRRRLRAGRGDPEPPPPAAQRIAAPPRPAAADGPPADLPDDRHRQRPAAPAAGDGGPDARAHRPFAPGRPDLTFRAFHSAHRKQWMLFARIALGSEAAAEQVVDAAFAQLQRRWGHALGQRSVRAHAWRVLRAGIAAWRAEHGEARTARDAGLDAALRGILPHPAGGAPAAPEDTLDLYRHISALPGRRFEVIVLHYALGLTEEEIADHLGSRPSAVRSHLRAATHDLAKLLGAEPPEKED